jgi:hypothetical protein
MSFTSLFFVLKLTRLLKRTWPGRIEGRLPADSYKEGPVISYLAPKMIMNNSQYYKMCMAFGMATDGRSLPEILSSLTFRILLRIRPATESQRPVFFSPLSFLGNLDRRGPQGDKHT